MALTKPDNAFGTTDDFELILWIFDDTLGGTPIVSFPRTISDVKTDLRLAAKIYSFLAMVNETLIQDDWTIMSVPAPSSPQNFRALCFGHFFETSWVVLSLAIPPKFSRWLLTYSPDLIPKFNQFFKMLKERGEVDLALETMLHGCLNDFKQYCRGIENLGVTDFSELEL